MEFKMTDNMMKEESKKKKLIQCYTLTQGLNIFPENKEPS